MDRNKLLVAIISFVIIGICITSFGKEREKGDESPVAEEKAEDSESSVEKERVEDSEGDSVEAEKTDRDPFSLPVGVRFREKKKEKRDGVILSANQEFPEGMVASNLNGIYQSGKNTTANINGIWVKEGDWVGEEQVIDIQEDNVILSREDGEKRTLSLQEAESELKVIKRVKPVSN
ncbi:MAG: hypothetical protein SCARUB_01589 [Candidatus Scalindua rubra]|uniref:Uncharacterized protein n=1 Tax=Candidatus Scalindua rubra TaxID=1872076 RepID=A0A1E3XCF1_9BACT|nr:MAG: hypothetical protein SCARUB_01589 [Candidatus Scalindua rubra]